MRYACSEVAKTFAVTILVLASVCANADPVAVDGKFNFRSIAAPGTYGGPFGADAIFFGAVDVVPNGNAGTVASYVQRDILGGVVASGQLPFLPLSQFPDNYFQAVGYSAGLLRPWELTFTNGSDITATSTLNLAGADVPLPFAQSILLAGPATTPTLSWKVPASGQSRIDVTEVYIWEQTGAGLDLIHLASLDPATTSHTLPAVLSSGKALQPGKRYTATLQFYENRDSAPTPGEALLNRSIIGVDFEPLADNPGVYLPAVLQLPGGIVYQFPVIDVVGGTEILIDPDVAVGYEYVIGDGDPNFRSVRLPVERGDGVYDVQLLVAGDWVTVATISGSDPTYDFGNGGTTRFRITGIEVSANLDPADPTAFITGVTFTGDGVFSGSMIPLPVPEPGTYAMLGAGLAVLALAYARSGRRRVRWQRQA